MNALLEQEEKVKKAYLDQY
jgi:hypothetical protein